MPSHTEDDYDADDEIPDKNEGYNNDEGEILDKNEGNNNNEGHNKAKAGRNPLWESSKKSMQQLP